MADGWNIFLSYEHSDRARALKLVDAFQQEGWSVWWDHKIPPGKTWADVLERAIKASECVVVLWSRTSITSEWVKKEARVAQIIVDAGYHVTPMRWRQRFFCQLLKLQNVQNVLEGRGRRLIYMLLLHCQERTRGKKAEKFTTHVRTVLKLV